jgi:hypothetical protein
MVNLSHCGVFQATQKIWAAWGNIRFFKFCPQKIWALWRIPEIFSRMLENVSGVWEFYGA